VVFCFLTSGIRLKAHTIIISPIINISVNYWCCGCNKKSLKIQKEYLETVNRKRTDNTNIKKTKGQTSIYKTLRIQLRIAFTFCIIITSIYLCVFVHSLGVHERIHFRPIPVFIRLSRNTNAKLKLK
jgi:hypothetical protein